MNAPRLVARYFGGGVWPRFARVLALSAARHCPTWQRDIQAFDVDARTSPLGSKSAVVNAQKLDAWAAIVAEAADGDRLLLIDVDTVILRPLDDVWDLKFDLAYTTKPVESRFPFNAGVLFLRITPAVRTFIATWRAENERMFHDAAYYQVWRPAYGGLNQSALGALFHNRAAIADLTIRRLPCVEWNCEDEHWAAFDAKRTRIVHYKGALHRALFDRGPLEEGMRPLIAIWRLLEGAASDRQIRPDELEDTMVRPTDLTIEAPALEHRDDQTPTTSERRPRKRPRRHERTREEDAPHADDGRDAAR